MKTIEFNPATHVLVPLEPTEEMVHAARKDYEGAPYLPFGVYKRMIAAAPAVPFSTGLILPRFGFMGEKFGPFPDGPYVRYADVSSLVPAAPAQQDRLDYKSMYENCRTEKAAVVARLKELVPNEFVYPAAPAQQDTQEQLAWEAKTSGYVTHVTHSRYLKFSPAVQSWYMPICPKCGPQYGAAPAQPVPDTSEEIDTLRRDALRYRLLRGRTHSHEVAYRDFENGFQGSFRQASGTELDQYIDKALQAKGEAKP